MAITKTKDALQTELYIALRKQERLSDALRDVRATVADQRDQIARLTARYRPLAENYNKLFEEKYGLGGWNQVGELHEQIDRLTAQVGRLQAEEWDVGEGGFMRPAQINDDLTWFADYLFNNSTLICDLNTDDPANPSVSPVSIHEKLRAFRTIAAAQQPQKRTGQ